MRLVAFVAAEAGRAQDQTAASQDAKVSAQDVRTVLQDAPLDAAHLRALAAERLPDYMVPDRVVLLETLPRLPGGKVDRAALRAIELPPLEAAPAAPAPPRDEAERALILLFEEALARRPLGARDDFLALGGDSLAALGLFDAIERRFGRALPLSTLLEAPTPEALARVLARPASAPLAASPLVAIRRGGSRPPLFLVHTGHGHVLRYRDLARALGDDQPVYGLAARGLDGGRPPTRVHAMAAEYLAAVEALDPAGPYLLGGMCIGGLVAFEMAQQLRARGKRVALLAVIDTFGIRGAPPPTAGEDAAAPPTRTLGGRLAGLLRRGARIGERRARFAAHGLATGIRWLASREARRRLRMARALRQAERSYAPRRYAGEVLLVRAGSDGASPGWERRWVELAAGGLARHVVPGTHADVLRGENVARVAAILRARIDAAATAREGERVGACSESS
jgi:thioesterase domain-containing protein